MPPKPRSRLRLWVCLALLCTPRVAAAVRLSDPGIVEDLRGVWLFHAGDNPAFARRSLDDLRWQERHVPTDSLAWSQRWAGFGWYRYHFTIEAPLVERHVGLSLGLAREAVEVFVNGELVMSRGRIGVELRGGARLLPLTGLVPAAVLRPGDNVIAVRVYDPTYAGGLVAGPLLLGNPTLVAERSRAQEIWTLLVRVGLAALALFVAAAYWATTYGRVFRREALWILGTGISLAVLHLDGTGLFALVPGVDFLVRLTDVASLCAVICLGSYFIDRFGDVGSTLPPLGRNVLLGLTAALALAPASWVFVAAAPLIQLSALAVAFYCTNLCARAARRNEEGSLPVFLGVSLLAMVIVYDGFAAAPSDVLPPLSAMGGVGLLVLVMVVQARHVLQEHALAVRQVRRQQQRLDGLAWTGLIDAATLPLFDPKSFLTNAVQEIARDFQVRRCSLVLNHADGTLRISASVGLPRHIASNVVPRQSISGYAFDTGAVVTPANLPKELEGSKHGPYLTDAFLSYPVMWDEIIYGVLNLSDRNDGGDFSATDEAAIAVQAQKLALAISRLPSEALALPIEEAPAAMAVSDDDIDESNERDADDKAGATTLARRTTGKFKPRERTIVAEDLADPPTPIEHFENDFANPENTGELAHDTSTPIENLGDFVVSDSTLELLPDAAPPMPQPLDDAPTHVDAAIDAAVSADADPPWADEALRSVIPPTPLPPLPASSGPDPWRDKNTPPPALPPAIPAEKPPEPKKE